MPFLTQTANPGLLPAQQHCSASATIAPAMGRCRHAAPTRVYADAIPPCVLQELPLTVLVNQRSASASEILAGALRDNCRAVVAGAPTFGKGLIQSVYELSDGSGLAVTVGKYLTPAGAPPHCDAYAPPAPRCVSLVIGACGPILQRPR